MRYIPLDSVLNFIPSGVREEQGDDDQLLSWALEGLRTTNIVHRYEKRICIIPINEHKAQLPSELRMINTAWYLSKEPNFDESEELCACIDQSCGPCEFETSATTTNDTGICRIPVNVQLFQQTGFQENCLSKMKYVGNYDVVCKNCPGNFCNGCLETYSVNKNLGIMTSFKEGWVCLNYEAELVNEAGQFMILEDVDFQRGLSYYVQAMHWLDRDSRKEQGAFQRYQQFLTTAERMLLKVKGKSRLMAVDSDLIYSITNTAHRLLRTPGVWARRQLTINENI